MKKIKIILRLLVLLILFSVGYIVAMVYELHNGYGFYSQKDDIQYKINSEMNKMIESGYLYVDSLEGYFQTMRENMTIELPNQHNNLDSFCLTCKDAWAIAKSTLYELYDVNDIEACAPYTISEDDSTYYVCGTFPSAESLPSNLAAKKHYSSEELEMVLSLTVYRPIYNVRIRKRDAKIIHVVRDI